MRRSVWFVWLMCASLVACAATPPRQPTVQPPVTAPTGTAHADSATASTNHSTTMAESNMRPTAPTLDPQRGQTIGFSYEAFLSPHQEPGEEEDTPGFVPEEFRSTAPSLPRDQRPSRGHGIVRFSYDLSVAYIDVQISGIDPADIVMFHIHCGRPDQLGPILIDFGHAGSFADRFPNGRFTATVTNADIEQASADGEGIVGVFTAGCPIIPGTPDKVKTIAGMEYIARQGDLYFNLHTKGQTFYGDMRGQLHLLPDQ